MVSDFVFLCFSCSYCICMHACASCAFSVFRGCCFVVFIAFYFPHFLNPSVADHCKTRSCHCLSVSSYAC